MTFTLGANPKWQPMNREEHSNKAFNSSEPPGSTSNKQDQQRKNTSQQEQIIRPTGQINIELINDNQNLLLDPSDSWHHMEIPPIDSRHIPYEQSHNQPQKYRHTTDPGTEIQYRSPSRTINPP